MKLKYYLVDNPVTPDPDDRRAQVLDYEVITEKEMFEYMTREGSAITPAEAKGNYEEIIGTFDHFMKQGYGINTEFINIRPVILGVFRDDDDRYDSVRHKIKFRAQLGKRYNHTADDVKAEKITQPGNQPLPLTFEDVSSETINENLTPGGTASLTGMRLLFSQADTQQGIFLLDSSKTEYRVTRILSHGGKKVVFQSPDGLPPGEYTLEVRMLPARSKKLKIGVLADRLIV
jgi:hypothetical protein